MTNTYIAYLESLVTKLSMQLYQRNLQESLLPVSVETLVQAFVFHPDVQQEVTDHFTNIADHIQSIHTYANPNFSSDPLARKQVDLIKTVLFKLFENRAVPSTFTNSKRIPLGANLDISKAYVPMSSFEKLSVSDYLSVDEKP